MSDLGIIGAVAVEQHSGSRPAARWAVDATDRIISVAPTALPETRARAQLYAEEIHRVITHTVYAAITAEMEWIAIRLHNDGLHDAARLVSEWKDRR